MASASAQPSFLELLGYLRLRVDAGEAVLPPWMIPRWIHHRDPYAETPEAFAAALLPLAAADGTTAWYFFHWVRPKNAGERRRTRVVTGGGSWKSERSAVPVNSTIDGQTGWRTPFSYTIKTPGGGEHRPGWVMQELLLPEESEDAGVVGLQELAISKIYRSTWGKKRSCSSSSLAASMAAGASSSASLAASPAAGASSSASLAASPAAGSTSSASLAASPAAGATTSFSPAASLAAGACSASPADSTLAPEASSSATDPGSSSSDTLAASVASSAAAALAAEAIYASAAPARACVSPRNSAPFTTNPGGRTSSASAAPAAAAMGLTNPPSPPRRWLVVPVGAHGSPPRPGDRLRLASLLGMAPHDQEPEPEAEGELDAPATNTKRVAADCFAWLLEAAGGAKKQRAA